MPMHFRWSLPRFAVLVLLAAPARLLAQHSGHDMSAMNDDSVPDLTAHLMAQAIPLVTRAAPTAGGVDKTQAVLTQTLVMLRAGWRGRLQLDATANAEGLV